MGGQINSRVSRGNRNGSWERFRDITGSFVWWGLSAMGMGGIFQVAIIQSTEKGII